MMGRQSRQMAMVFVDIESLIPETHLLRKIERMVSEQLAILVLLLEAVHLQKLNLSITRSPV